MIDLARHNVTICDASSGIGRGEAGETIAGMDRITEALRAAADIVERAAEKHEMAVRLRAEIDAARYADKPEGRS